MTWEMVLGIPVIVALTVFMGEFMEKGIAKLKDHLNEERRNEKLRKDEHEEFPGI